MRPLIIPTVNLNGTSGDQLIEQQLGIQSAFRALNEALAVAMPHGRDYPARLTENDSYAAREAYSERRLELEKMRHEFELIAMDIVNQVMARQDIAAASQRAFHEESDRLHAEDMRLGRDQASNWPLKGDEGERD